MNQGSIKKCLETAEVIVVVDEFCSVARQTLSTYGNAAMAASTFSLLMQTCQVIAMDAYFDQYTMDILEKLCQTQPYLIHNTYKSRIHHEVTLSRDIDAAREWMFGLIENGENIHCPCTSKDVADEIYALFIQRFGDNDECVLITKDKQWDGKDVNETWPRYRLVIHTSTLDCGTSFEGKGHFNRCIVFLKNTGGPVAETMAQMMSRARDVSVFHFCCPLPERKVPPMPTAMSIVLREESSDITEREATHYGTMTAAQKRQAKSWVECSSVAAIVAHSKVCAHTLTHKHMIDHDMWRQCRCCATRRKMTCCPK